MSAPPRRQWFRSLIDGPPPVAPVPQPVAAPAPRFDFADPRIPDASQAHLATIRALLAGLAATAPTPGIVALQVEAARIGEVYLPELMRSYFAIPSEHRAEIFRETGRSASFMLNDRLDKLIARLRDLSRQVAQSPLDTFNQHLGFVDARFGDPETPFPWQRD